MIDAALEAARAIERARKSPGRAARREAARRIVSDWVDVCRIDEIVPNTGVCALVGTRQVAVFRLADDSLYALDNHDPFSHANVLSRGIVGDLNGEIVVASPVYKQHFSLATGRCLEDQDVQVAVYPVRRDGDTVRVRLPEA